MDAKAVGERIRKQRKVKGLTQEELAEKVNLSTMSIRRYEGGERIIPEDTLQFIAHALDVPISYLTNDTRKIEIPMPDYPISLPSTEELARMAPAEQEYYYLRLLADTAPDQLKKMYNDNYDNLNKLGQVEAVRRTAELSKLSQYTAPDLKNKPLVLTEIRSDPLTDDKE